jgi:uncharacterized protein (UPF0276 family)
MRSTFESNPMRERPWSTNQLLGVGMPLLRTVPDSLYSRKDLIQFIEFTPETVCRVREFDGCLKLELDHGGLFDAKRRAGGLPMVVHGVELSIGSAHGWNQAYVTMLDEVASHWPFVWHSEHLGFQTYVDTAGFTHEVGIPLPLPVGDDVTRIVASRIAELGCRFNRPFLIENAAQYLPGIYSDARSEGCFVSDICGASDCGLLLDLHNLYCNAVNFGFDPREVVDAMPLERVIEIHVAGGSAQDGFWTDAHDGAVPQSVWEILEYIAPRLPNWSALVFEVLDRIATRLPLSLYEEELGHANAIWERYRPKAGPAVRQGGDKPCTMS